jgi:AmmeMemoRadiSam system protein A
MFTIEQHKYLLNLAREAVDVAVRHGRKLMREEDTVEEALRKPLGAFVTLTAHDALRGCIGYTEPLYPLYETIIRAGTAAALQDPRFLPVTARELADLHFEISVLSPLQLATPDEIIIGTHGLVIEQGRARGLLLPQVPVELGWGREEFLAHTCQKAGLPSDAWRSNATLYTFTAEVFADH